MLKESIGKPDTVFEAVANLTLVNLRYCDLILTQLPHIAYALSRSLSIKDSISAVTYICHIFFCKLSIYRARFSSYRTFRILCRLLNLKSHPFED
jgi:hypothetical protein